MATKLSLGQLDDDVISAMGGTPTFSAITGDPMTNTELAADLNAKWTEPANSAIVEDIDVALTTALNATFLGKWDTPSNATTLANTTAEFLLADEAIIDGLHAVSSNGLYSALESTDKPVYKKSIYAGTDDPDNTDDTSAGYGVGSYWHNQTDDVAWVCLDVTASNAVWKQIDFAQKETDSTTNTLTTGLKFWKGTSANWLTIAAGTPDDDTLYVLVDP